MRRLTVELYRTRKGKFRARIKGTNGRILYMQSEAVNRMAHAKKIANQLVRQMQFARIRVVDK